MKINLELMTQARQVAGRETVEAELPEGCTLEQALREIVSSRLASLGPLVFRNNGSLLSSVLLVVNGQMVADPASHVLAHEDAVSLLTPMGGG